MPYKSLRIILANILFLIVLIGSTDLTIEYFQRKHYAKELGSYSVPYTLDKALNILVTETGHNNYLEGLDFLAYSRYKVGYEDSWFIATDMSWNCTKDLYAAAPWAVVTLNHIKPNHTIEVIDLKDTSKANWYDDSSRYDFVTTLELNTVFIDIKIDVDTLDCYDSDGTINIRLK